MYGKYEHRMTSHCALLSQAQQTAGDDSCRFPGRKVWRIWLQRQQGRIVESAWLFQSEPDRLLVFIGFLRFFKSLSQQSLEFMDSSRNVALFERSELMKEFV